MASTVSEVLAGEASFAVLCGDATELLKTLPPDTFHVCYCDPPYGLSKQTTEDVTACLRAWLAGEVYHHGHTGFLGKDWDAFVPGPEAWREVYRVLKPGAFCVAYSSTRTVDLLGIAIRLAGGEMREGWAWVFGQGFPKNHDVSKALDKVNGETTRALQFTAWMRTTGTTATQLDAALRDAGVITPKSSYSSHLFYDGQPAVPTARVWGVLRPLCGEIPRWVDELVERIEAERTVVGTKSSSLGGTVAAEGNPEYIERHRDAQYNVTVAATEEAKQWEGWGTTTKPCFEPLVVSRKPIMGTVAQNVVSHGCGVLNIDGARISTMENLNGGAYAKEGTERHDGAENWRYKRDGGAGGYQQPAGRYPPALALVHDEGCVLVGTSIIQGNRTDTRPDGDGGRSDKLQYRFRPTEATCRGYADPDGTETVDQWVCTPSCAVAELGRQSGESDSPETTVRGTGGRNSVYSEIGAQGIVPSYGDSGTATRFFYQGKARAADRLAYLTCNSECPRHGTVVAKSQNTKRELCESCGNPVKTYMHPTVKPLDLARYHAKLLSLPAQVRPLALVPFCGTGIEALALVEAGFRVVAVDIDPRHCAMTLHRLQTTEARQTPVEFPKAPDVAPPKSTSLEDLLGW